MTMSFSKAAIYLNNAGVSLLQCHHSSEAIETLAHAIQILKHISAGSITSQQNHENPSFSLSAAEVTDLIVTTAKRLAFSRQGVQSIGNSKATSFTVVSNIQQAHYLAKSSFLRLRTSCTASPKILLTVEDDSDMTDFVSFVSGIVLYNYSIGYWADATIGSSLDRSGGHRQIFVACLQVLSMSCTALCSTQEDSFEDCDVVNPAPLCLEDDMNQITLYYVVHELVQICSTLERSALLQEYSDYQDYLRIYLSMECLAVEEPLFAGAA